MDIEQSIKAGIDRLGAILPEGAVSQLAVYLALLQRWNRAYNLTAVSTLESMIVRHVLDSLAILPWIAGDRVLDVGSGAGLPGIPLALACPMKKFFLLDSSGKRTRFLKQVVAELRLPHVQVVHSRVENYRPDDLFHTIVARAFATLEEFLTQAGRLCAPQGRLLAMKGIHPTDELTRLPLGYTLVGVYPLQVPYLDAARCLVHLTPAAARG